jgi:glyoxylase-like metal-dependent hydrolase (beta-lactamase superfamily II)
MRPLAAAVAALLSLPCAAAAQDDLAKVEIKVHKVAGTVYMLEGAGGNIGVSIGEDGVLIVDDQFAPLAPKIRAAITSVTDKPLRYVLNTHWHGDHVGGNKAFSSEATVIAHDNVRKRMASGTAPGSPFKVAPAGKDELPVITFDHSLTVHVNGEDIRALHFANGHTDGDSIIYFPKSNVVHMGDDFVTYGLPFIDVASGGSIRGLIQNTERAIAELPDDVKIIPGHGPVSGKDDVRRFTAMLKECVELVESARKQGKSLEQAQQGRVLEKIREARRRVREDERLHRAHLARARRCPGRAGRQDAPLNDRPRPFRQFRSLTEHRRPRIKGATVSASRMSCCCCRARATGAPAPDGRLHSREVNIHL